MKKWEYKTLSVTLKEASQLVDKLNLVGEFGWELVSSYTIELKSVGMLDNGSETSGIVAVLKREKE